MAVSEQALRYRKSPTRKGPATKLSAYRDVDRSQPYRTATCCLSRFCGQGMATVSTSQTCRLRRTTCQGLIDGEPCIVARGHSFINLTAAIRAVPITLYGNLSGQGSSMRLMSFFLSVSMLKHIDRVKSTGKPLMHGTGSSLAKSIDSILLNFAQGLGSKSQP